MGVVAVGYLIGMRPTMALAIVGLGLMVVLMRIPPVTHLLLLVAAKLSSAPTPPSR